MLHNLSVIGKSYDITKIYLFINTMFLFPVGRVQQTAIQREKYRWNHVSSRGKDRSLKNLESAVSRFPNALQLKNLYNDRNLNK